MYTFTTTIPHVSESSPFHPQFNNKANTNFDVNYNDSDGRIFSENNTNELSQPSSLQSSNHFEIYNNLGGSDNTQNEFSETVIQFTTNGSEIMNDQKIPQILLDFDQYQKSEGLEIPDILPENPELYNPTGKIITTKSI